MHKQTKTHTHTQTTKLTIQKKDKIEQDVRCHVFVHNGGTSYA